MVKAKYQIALLLGSMLAAPIWAAGGQHPPAQEHSHQHDGSRAAGVNERGDHAMGFSHEKTTHHFRLTTDGGVIEVTANDPKDVASRDMIRMHLAHIAKLFKEGDFSKPMFTHGEVPSGVPALQRLKGEISYTFDPVERGGKVIISTSNAEAIRAAQEFLRYQINDHKTGDSLEVSKEP